MKTAAWIAAAALAGGALLAIALTGERPDAGIARYRPDGVMLALAPERVTRVEVVRDGRQWTFARTASGWAASPDSPVGRKDPGPGLDLGLRLLHGSVPQRVMTAAEARELSLRDAGLEPPVLTVRVEAPGTPGFAVAMGGPNPQGLARYARVAGTDEVVLLNHYVVEPWLSLAEGP